MFNFSMTQTTRFERQVFLFVSSSDEISTEAVIVCSEVDVEAGSSLVFM